MNTKDLRAFNENVSGLRTILWTCPFSVVLFLIWCSFDGDLAGYQHSKADLFRVGYSVYHSDRKFDAFVNLLDRFSMRQQVFPRFRLAHLLCSGLYNAVFLPQNTFTDSFDSIVHLPIHLSKFHTGFLLN